MTGDEAFQHMADSFRAGRMAQAYVVTAPPRGAGAELAERVLQLLFCRAPDGPCGSCRECDEATAYTHPDVLWVEPQKKSRVISVEQVRNVEQRIYHTAFAGGWKACVLLGADRLNASAANAFLKTLEEPPARSVFLLLTDSPQFLLPTIVSRCQRLALSGDYSALPERWRSKVIAVLTDSRGEGSIASLARSDRMLSLLKEIRKEAETQEAEKLSAETEETAAEILDARTSARYREMRTSLLRLILRWHRDVLLLVAGGDEALVHNRDHIEFLKGMAAGMHYRDAARNVALVETMNRRLESNLPDAQVLAAGWGELA